jgi:DNA-binding transcriptional LysR family regulator
MYRCQPRRDQISRRDIIEADDSKILRNSELIAPRSLNNAYRQSITRGQDGGWSRFASKDPFRGSSTAFFVQRPAELGIGYLAAESGNRQVGALKSCTIATSPIGVAVAMTVEHNYRGGSKLQDFAHEPFLILDPKYALGYVEWTRSIFLLTGFEPVKTISVDSAEAFFALICAGIGVGLLSPLHFGGQSAGVSFRELSKSVGHFPLSLVWDAQRASPLVNDFLAVVRQVLPNPNGALMLNNHGCSLAAAMSGVLDFRKELPFKMVGSTFRSREEQSRVHTRPKLIK